MRACNKNSSWLPNLKLLISGCILRWVSKSCGQAITTLHLRYIYLYQNRTTTLLKISWVDSKTERLVPSNFFTITVNKFFSIHLGYAPLHNAEKRTAGAGKLGEEYVTVNKYVNMLIKKLLQNKLSQWAGLPIFPLDVINWSLVSFRRSR